MTMIPGAWTSNEFYLPPRAFLLAGARPRFASLWFLVISQPYGHWARELGVASMFGLLAKGAGYHYCWMMMMTMTIVYASPRPESPLKLRAKQSVACVVHEFSWRESWFSHIATHGAFFVSAGLCPRNQRLPQRRNNGCRRRQPDQAVLVEQVAFAMERGLFA